ncbi:CPBP family intramembrane glutamic endopeptidase [Neobacillus sp. SAB-20_R2A]|uniref:CPBP family intramembrane glutamic endopeptidase n=1 Tax=Neobacillus sp. SAB-20_R2A TaxID=3120519 RepID=UPI003C6DDC18
MSYFVKAIVGFIILDVYLNVGIAGASSFWVQVVLVLLFFPLLKGILFLTKKDFKRIGISFHPKWWKNMMMGFAIGFSFWLIKYGIEYSLNGYEITGAMPFSQMILSLLMIMLTFFVGSFLNDIIVRGYVFGHLKGKIPMKWVFILSLVLYALDDSWNEGFSLSNTLFSLLLGLSLTYAIYKTGSIWADTGIHWGLNVCYGIFNGTLGSTGGGMIITKDGPPSLLLESISYIIPLLMFLFLYLVRNKLRHGDGSHASFL